MQNDAYRFSVRDDTSFRVESGGGSEETSPFTTYMVTVNVDYEPKEIAIWVLAPMLSDGVTVAQAELNAQSTELEVIAGTDGCEFTFVDVDSTEIAATGDAVLKDGYGYTYLLTGDAEFTLTDNSDAPK